MRGLAVAILLLLAVAPAAQAGNLQRDLDRALKPIRSHAAVSVYDTRARRTVYALRARSARPLGSNAKLFTTAAALRALPELLTTVVGDPAGDLYLVGGGNPVLKRGEMESLADQVYRAGVRSVAGGIVGDGTRFGPSPPYDPEVGGVLGALVYDRGRAVDGGPFQPDPALAAATRFDDALEARGITVARGQRSGPAPAGAPVLAAVAEPSSGELAFMMNKPSDNFIAEMLTRALGGPAEVVRHSRGRAQLVDGSGISSQNRAAPRDVVALLRRNAIEDKLPVAGRDGTVAGRMKDTRGRCRVKTGTIRGAKVSVLSGHCGRHVFSILVQGASVERARRAQDLAARVLARK